MRPAKTTSKLLRASIAAGLGVLALGASTASAQSGGVGGPGGGTEPPPEDPTAPAPAPAPSNKQFFPISGAHTFEDGFGADRGSRSHQGVDIFAECGTPEVAVMNGTVVFSGFQSSAGNYLVVRNKKIKRDYVYMHMRKPGVRKGTKVTGGQWVGAVGDSGNASGCHLHFEIWKGKWWRGGKPLDPMPSLLAWDRYS